MRVALDTSGLYTTRAGVSRHLRGLLKGLAQVRSPDVETVEVAWQVENFDYKQPARACKTLYRELVWAPFLGPGLLRKASADLLHSNATILIDPPAPIRHVFTLHDLAILRNPARFRAWQKKSFLRGLKKLDRVQKVICISQFTADEAMELMELPANKIEVVPNGCDFQDAEADIPESNPLPGFSGPFFLFVGSLEPGKNLALLRDAYALARKARRELPPLIIVGARWAGVATEGDRPENWHYLGNQPDSALVYLYRRALALVFPSKYEGFGLPIVEAMTLGAPVICSRVASLPEVGGEAAYYSPMSAEGYLEAMEAIASRERLRSELRELGRQQARKFSWQKCASQTIDVYRSATR